MKAQHEKMLQLICIYLAIQFGTTCSQNPTCPFEYLYHFGDGVTDIGNSIHVIPNITIPSARSPYGMTNPGYPTGRWSDGLIDFDFTAIDFGLPNIVPYLGMNNTEADLYNGIIFSVARSPVLDRKFFTERNITIAAYVVPLSQQFTWFKNHLDTICTTRSNCSEWIGNSLVLMGDIEGNDIGYALTQGKTIAEVETYVPDIVKAIIDTSREIINMGARRLIIPGNGPLGCMPYILTALQTSDTTAYDELGCLKSVNNFTIWKNNYLQQAIGNLKSEFPDAKISFGSMYDGVWDLITNASVIGPNGNSALKSCCGIGGNYNYDPKKFCGDEGVRPCPEPNDFIFWDGMHFTQQTHQKIEKNLVGSALDTFNCTPLISDIERIKRSRVKVNNLASYIASQ